MRVTLPTFVKAACATVLLLGCATSSGGQRTPFQRALIQCGITTVVGAGVGAVIGHNTDGDAERGAMIGGGVALTACAVYQITHNYSDRQRMANAESRAAASGQQIVASYAAPTGGNREVVVIPDAVPAFPLPSGAPRVAEDATRFVGPCRRARTTVNASTARGQRGTASYEQTYCRTEADNWLPVPG